MWPTREGLRWKVSRVKQRKFRPYQEVASLRSNMCLCLCYMCLCVCVFFQNLHSTNKSMTFWLCVRMCESKAAYTSEWSLGDHMWGFKHACSALPLEGPEWFHSWGRCRWCCRTCRRTADLTSLIWSYQALLQFHGCLEQVGHVL